jgi:hypothetical protein
MRSLSKIGLAVCVSLVASVFAPNAHADEWNKKTIFTFSAPVEVPGQVLPAGTYMFKLFDSPSDRNIVQIFNSDGTHLYATIMAIPDYRMTPTGKTVITFSERAQDLPEAVRAWFYPGDLYGNEFVYPHVRAMQLASTNKVNVPETTGTAASNLPISSKSAPEVQALEKSPVTVATPENTETSVAEAMPAKSLPKTASGLPFLALIGLLLLGSSFGIGLIAKRFSIGRSSPHGL